jgi:hypothetical protein
MIIIPGTHLLALDSSFTIGSTGFPLILFNFVDSTTGCLQRTMARPDDYLDTDGTNMTK